MKLRAPAIARGAFAASIVLVAFLALSFRSCLADPHFTHLGFLNVTSGPSIAFGVSSDGNTVVGETNSPQGIQAFRWREGQGMIGLGDIPGGFFASVAYACSGDGSTIVGASEDATSGEEGTPFVWTEQTGMVPLGTLGGPTSYGQAEAITPDGSVIVGASQAPSGIFAFRWSRQTGMVSLGDFSGDPALSRASGVTADGNVVVGTGSRALTFDQAFRWTDAGGLVGVGSSNSFSAVTPDGQYTIGKNFQGAFRWSAQDGFVQLGRLNGGLGVYFADAISADGSTIVGLADYDGIRGTGEAFIWDPVHQMRDLNVVLTQDYGLNLQGMFLFDARSISADGKVISGYGVNAQGEQEAWVVNLRTAAGAPEADASPTAGRLTWTQPNPFSSTTSIGFTLPRSAPISLDVYDESGRLVRSLIEGESYSPGVHSITWDGRAGDGRRAPAGTYFYRLNAGGKIEEGRAIRVR